MSRPRIAVPGRFTESASALRYRGVVSARLLLEGIWLAGGDPVTFLPSSTADGVDWATRMEAVDGVLLPGGGDVNPRRYGKSDDDPSLYDVDEVQDESDFTLAAYAFAAGLPLLAICRGLHVVNALRGGTLVVDMPVNHRHHSHQMHLEDTTDHLGLGTTDFSASCYHHQAVENVGAGLRVLGRSTDGWVEAIAVEGGSWAAAVQWHPEDTYLNDPVQQALFGKLVKEAAKHRSQRLGL